MSKTRKQDGILWRRWDEKVPEYESEFTLIKFVISKSMTGRWNLYIRHDKSTTELVDHPGRTFAECSKKAHELELAAARS